MVVKKGFKDIKDMITEAIDIDVESGISFITKYDNAALIVKELLGCYGLMPHFIQLSDPMWDSYDNEFIITVNSDGDVFCEKYCRDGKYLLSEDDVIFILPDCTVECAEFIYGNNDCVIVEIDFKDLDAVECDDDIEPINEIQLELVVEPNILRHLFRLFD